MINSKPIEIQCELELFNGFELPYDEIPTQNQWIFPANRFVEYERSDESWCRYFGIGEEKEVMFSMPFVVTQMEHKIDNVIVSTTIEFLGVPKC